MYSRLPAWFPSERVSWSRHRKLRLANATEFFAAAGNNGNLANVRLLLDRNPNLAFSKNREGWLSTTPRLMASRADSLFCDVPICARYPRHDSREQLLSRNRRVAANQECRLMQRTAKASLRCTMQRHMVRNLRLLAQGIASCSWRERTLTSETAWDARHCMTLREAVESKKSRYFSPPNADVNAGSAVIPHSRSFRRGIIGTVTTSGSTCGCSRPRGRCPFTDREQSQR